MSSTYDRLLIPVNGSSGDLRVLRLVGDLVHRHNVAITLVYVVEVAQAMPLDADLPLEIERGEAALHRAEEFARSQLGHKIERMTTDLLQARSAGAAIVDEAIERHADAIWLAAVNRVIHGKATIGETAGYVLKNAPCEVVIVRLAPDEANEESSWS